MDLSTLLINAQQADASVRQAAEAALAQAEAQSLGGFLYALTAELADNNKQPIARQLAGIVFKNRIDSKDPIKKAQYYRDWLSLEVGLRNNIKNGVVQTLAAPVAMAWQAAAQVCAKLAVIELPEGQWPMLIDQLLYHMSPSQPNETLKQATLTTLGFICEEIPFEAVQDKSNVILTAVVQGMRPEEKNNSIKLAAAKALHNALEFASQNFESQNERDHIMRVVCEAIQSSDQAVKIAGYECLVKIASLYYEKLPGYMQGIFNVTLESIKRDDASVALQAIEFWSTICDEEFYLLEKTDEDLRNGIPSSVTCHNFIKGALKFIVPLILECLTKQDEDAEADDWDVSMAAATCLNLIANVVADEVVPHVVPFVQQYITNTNWHFREASVMAFGSILEGPKELVPLIRQALPVLIQHMKDSSVPVKDTAAWTLGRVCQLHPIALRGDPINYVMQALLEGLGDNPKVATNVCWALQKIAEAFEDEDIRPFTNYVPYFQPVVMQLLRASERSDANENHLRASAYEAINAFIMAAPPDTNPIVGQLMPVIIDRLTKSFSLPVLTQDDKDNVNELQALLCGVLQSCVQKLEKEVRPFADQMMDLFLRVFNSRSASAHEEALMAVGALCYVLEAEFEKYMPQLRHFLLVALRNYEEYQVCNVAVGVVGDVCRALQRKVIPYCDEIVTILVETLQKPSLNRQIKPMILSCFGDIGLAICGEFVKYLQVIMTLLHQASAIKLEPNDMKDDELVDSLNRLREGIFQAYTGIIQGLRTDNQAEHFLPYVPVVVHFVGVACHDPLRTDSVTRCAIGVIGDLAHALGAKAKQPLQQDFVKNLIAQTLESDIETTVDVARWAQEVVNKL